MIARALALKKKSWKSRTNTRETWRARRRRNAADGSVEAHLEGEKWSVQQLIDRLHRGPPSAQVGKLDVEVIEPEGADSFEVRH